LDLQDKQKFFVLFIFYWQFIWPTQDCRCQKHLHRYCTEFYRYNSPQQLSVERFEDALGKVSSTRICMKS